VEASRQSRVCAGAANEVACAIFRWVLYHIVSRPESVQILHLASAARAWRWRAQSSGEDAAKHAAVS
jgi:hypothetical protein